MLIDRCLRVLQQAELVVVLCSGCIFLCTRAKSSDNQIVICTTTFPINYASCSPHDREVVTLGAKNTYTNPTDLHSFLPFVYGWL